MYSGIEIKVFKSINDLGRDAVNSIVDDGFFTYDWFKTLETAQPIKINPFYLTAFYKGQVVGFVPCFLDVTDEYFRYAPSVFPLMKKLLNIGNYLRISEGHVLLCYSPFCYRTKLFVKRGFNERLVTDSLLKEIHAFCKREKILFSCFLFVSEFDKSLSEILSNLKYHKFIFPLNLYYLPIEWNTFDDYVSSLKPKVRRKIKREITSCKQNGVAIQEIRDFKDLATRLSDLSSNLLIKYNETRLYKRRFYESLSEYAKDRIKIFIATKRDVVIGFSLSIRQGKTLEVFHCGFDYKIQAKTDFTYFNLVYYSPIEWAIQEDIQKIYYRCSADKVKLRRGCKTERVFAFVKCHNRFVNSQLSNYVKIKNGLYWE